MIGLQEVKLQTSRHSVLKRWTTIVIRLRDAGNITRLIQIGTDSDSCSARLCREHSCAQVAAVSETEDGKPHDTQINKC